MTQYVIEDGHLIFRFTSDEGVIHQVAAKYEGDDPGSFIANHIAKENAREQWLTRLKQGQ
jgi:hypothetical protein